MNAVVYMERPGPDRKTGFCSAVHHDIGCGNRPTPIGSASNFANPKRNRRFISLLNIQLCGNDSHGANVCAPKSFRRAPSSLSLCLTKTEIKELTLKVRYAAQVRVLSEMGIAHTIRPDGSPVVFYSTLSTLAGIPSKKSNQPDFSSLG